MDDGTENPTIKSVHVRIEGRVQGVWYRAWTKERARHLGLIGWVRNRADGSVEVVFAGAPGTVDAMVEACREGPPAARVTAVTLSACAVPEATVFKTRATL